MILLKSTPLKLSKSSHLLPPCVSCSWCRLHHQRKIKAVNVVIVEGLTQSHFYKHYLSLQHLRTNYTTVRTRKNVYIYGWCQCFGLTLILVVYLTGLEGDFYSITNRPGVRNLQQ